MNKLLSLLLLLGLTAGCQSQPRVAYKDPDEVETVNENYGRTDLKLIVNRMVKSMINTVEPDLEGRPYIAIRPIKNDIPDGEYVDTKAITDKIRTAVLKSRKFRFTTERENLADQADTMERVTESGYYDNSGPGGIKKGGWKPPQFLLRGRMTAIKKQNDDVRDVYYLVTLYLDSLQEATTVWSEEKEINKRVIR